MKQFSYAFLVVLLYSCSISACKKHIKADLLIGSVPLTIFEELKKENCDPVSDFYGSRIVENPPFVKTSFNQFVSVCQKVLNSITTYYLIVSVKQDNELTNCPKKIKLGFKPGGVSIGEYNADGLDYFNMKEENDKNVYYLNGKRRFISIGDRSGGFIEIYCTAQKVLFRPYT